MSDERRINVAVTRARRHLCLICDSQTCKNDQFLKSFLDYCEQHADVRSGFDYQDDDVVSDNVTFSRLKINDDSKKKKTDE